MTFDEFKNIAMAIREAYPNSSAMKTEEGIQIWYEMLKDLEYADMTNAVSKYIKSNRFPPAISEIRSICRDKEQILWSREWIRLLNGSFSRDLNEAGQYAIKIITRDHFESCRDNPSRMIQCMKEFERLYKEYTAMSSQEKKQFFGTKMFQLSVNEIEAGDGG